MVNKYYVGRYYVKWLSKTIFKNSLTAYINSL